jgi:predicted regulator of Ras-like GTPase activity (Roadblock/LC7/MglB family)
MALLQDILDRVIALQGVRMVLVAGRDGLPITHAPRIIEDAEALAGYGANMLQSAESLGTISRRTAIVGLIIEYGDTLLSIEPLGEQALTIARIDTATALVPLRQSLRQARQELLVALDAL